MRRYQIGLATPPRAIGIANQDVYLDGRWVAHLSVSGDRWYGALAGRLFVGDSDLAVARQIEQYLRLFLE
jgi:hypothetical protein